MAKQTINIGASPNDGTGTPLRTAFDYCNLNFTELYTATGPSGNNIVVPGTATITGDLTVDTSTLKVDSANNYVGIGTASPVQKLHADNQANSCFIRTTSTQNSAGFDFGVGGTGDATAYINNRNNTPIVFAVNDTEAMRLNSSGNLGIGVTPSAWASAWRANEVQRAGNALISNAVNSMGLTSNAYLDSVGWKYGATGTANFLAVGNGNGSLAFYQAPSGTAGNAITFTQAMTLDASGNLLVGQTNAALDAQGGFWLRNAAASGGSSLIVNHRTGVISANSYAEFTYNGVGIGSITQNGTTGVLYNINSDYRLKESVAPLSSGLARVSALKPSIYKWKSDGSSGEGFLAHELAEVVPFAVTGEKDAVNEDGSIKSQGIDMSRIVPILVAAIQELTARVQTLEAK